MNYELIKLNQAENNISLEAIKNVPFEIKRISYFLGKQNNISKNKYSYKNIKQLIVCIKGSCTFSINDGTKNEVIELSNANEGLYIDNLIWRKIVDYTPDCVVIILSNEYYNDNEYIINDEDFTSAVKEQNIQKTLNKIKKNLNKINLSIPSEDNQIRLKEIQEKYNLDRDFLNKLSFKKGLFEQKLGEIETLALGSSHCELAFDPDQINGFAYNLGDTSQDLYYAYKLYESYIDKMPKLKNIIVFYSTFTSGNELQMSSKKFLCYGYDGLFNINPKYKFDDDYKKEEINFYLNKFCQVPLRGYYKGYKKIYLPYDENIKDIKSHYKHNIRRNNQTEFVKKIYELAQENNHNLIIIIPPMTSKYKKHFKEFYGKEELSSDEIFNDLIQLQKKLDLTIFNFYEDNPIKDKDFSDLEHLNPNGAEKLSKIINQYLFKSLK
jgi:hypothetical protein